MENDAIPDVVVDKTQLNFETLYYGSAQSQTLFIQNKGKVIAQFHIGSGSDVQGQLKPWYTITPQKGAILPGDTLRIHVTLSLNTKTIASAHQQELDDILILHTENGKDHFISVSAPFSRSSFGLELSTLVKLDGPVARYSFNEFQALLKPSQTDLLNQQALETAFQQMMVTPASDQKFSIPKEVFKLVDFIHKHGKSTVN